MNKTFGIISGFASIIGLGITIGLTYYALQSDLITDFKEVLTYLSITVFILLLSTIFLFVYYFNQVDKFKDYPAEIYRMRIDSRNYEIKLQNSAAYFHTIAHYYRNLVYGFGDILQTEEPSTENVNDILQMFERFLNTLTSNLQSYLTLYTGDNCAVTIKIVKKGDDGEPYVKTFYRDPIHYRQLKKSDKVSDNNDKVLKLNSNTAFSVISSPKEKSTTFLCDDLVALWKSGNYNNLTAGWMQLYNATAVVPINKRVINNDRNIIGFLCVDNFSGNLANAFVENYLCAIADMLFHLFVQFEKIVILSDKLGVSNARIKTYTTWNISEQN